MWDDNAATAYIVLGIGNLLGGVTKGVTGFGSAILNLCTYIVCVVAGIDSGTLQQAVVCEALSSTLIAPVLLYVTRAHATADLKMVTAISVFVALSSPLGAGILARLDAKMVELVMGGALLAIIVAEQLSKLVFHAWQQPRPCGHSVSSSSHTPAGQQLCSAAQVPQTGSAANTAAAAAAAEGEAAASDCTVCLFDGGGSFRGVVRKEAECENSRASKWWIAGSAGAAASAVDDDDAADGAAAADQQQGSMQEPLLAARHSSSSSCSCGGSDAGDVGASDAAALDAVRMGGSEVPGSTSTGSVWCRSAQAWAKVLGIGAVAGTLSGIMEGLTGMNGPPIMLFYRRLDTPKATVRGNNAFLNLLQMRLVPYWYMGLIVAKDLQLYGVACAAGVVGVVLGDRLSYRMDQRVFQQALGVLMVLCCFLMFASGLGIVK